MPRGPQGEKRPAEARGKSGEGTWIVNNAVTSYHAEFDSREKCDVARLALLNDQKRINGNAQMTPLGFQRPEASAICVSQ